MRRRLIWGTIAVIAAVLLALVPPVVILLRRAAERELEVRLSSQASAVSIEIADELLAGEVPSVGAIQPLVQPGDELVILDATGTQILHLGEDVGDGITGRAAGPAGTTVEVRVAREALDRRVRTPLLALGAFALGSILLGAALAWFVGRRLTRPLDQLAVTAARLGDGDRALDYARALAELCPRDPGAWRWFAQAALTASDLPAADLGLARLWALDPSEWAAAGACLTHALLRSASSMAARNSMSPA